MRTASPVKWLTDAQWLALPPTERALIIAHIAADIIKVREHGRNAGPEVREYLRAVGLGEGFAWCAAFVTYCLLEGGWSKERMPANRASACAWFAWGEREPAIGVTSDVRLLKRGDLVGWCDRAAWHGHIGLLLGVHGDSVSTIEGNTDAQGGSEGDGVYRRVRRWDASKMLAVRLA